MQFIVSGQRIATENFVTGKLYTILFKNDTQVNLMCISIGADCVVFQGEAPLNLFTLTMQNADTIDTIEPTQLGTTNYNNLINKPSINGVDLIGNKTSAALGIRDVPAIIESDDGKILTASSDGTYTWQPAPSSGTMDYTQLNNKPQINSVTLTGNVSLADLGAAAAADIPTTPADIGAEPAITSENMLDADLVDDTSSTHKFATAAQLAQIGTNENNILLINNNLIYSPTEPTGTIADGAIWINTAPTALTDYIKKYHINRQIFDFTTWLATVTSINGTGSYTSTSDTITITGGNANDVFTIPYDGNVVGVYKLTVEPSTKYTISLTADTETTKNFVFENGSSSGGRARTFNKSLTFTTFSDTTFLTFRFGFTSTTPSQTTVTFSNIMLNTGDRALPYELYDNSGIVWHSNNT